MEPNTRTQDKVQAGYDSSGQFQFSAHKPVIEQENQGNVLTDKTRTSKEALSGEPTWKQELMGPSKMA